MVKFRVQIYPGYYFNGVYCAPEIVHVWGYLLGNYLVGPDGFCEVSLDVKRRCLVWET